jgi:hypothetical protein
VTYVYVPGASNGELPRYLPHQFDEPTAPQPNRATHILPKLNARLILSVLKYLEHRPQRLPNGCRVKALAKKDGRSRERYVSNVLERTSE